MKMKGLGKTAYRFTALLLAVGVCAAAFGGMLPAGKAQAARNLTMEEVRARLREDVTDYREFQQIMTHVHEDRALVHYLLDRASWFREAMECVYMEEVLEMPAPAPKRWLNRALISGFMKAGAVKRGIRKRR